MRWRYAYTVLALVVAANFTQVGSRLMIGALVPDVIGTFAVSKSAIGLALTGMWAVYAAFQFPSGVLGDRFGKRRVILAAVVLTGVGGLLLALSPTFVLFGLFAVFLGAGAGLFFPVATGLLTDLFENTGGAVGLMTAGGAFSGLVAPVAAAWLAVHYGWRTALLSIVVVATIVVILFAWRVDATDGGDQGAVGWPSPAAIRQLLVRPQILYSVAVASVAVFAFQSITSFLPTFFVEYRGFSTATAGVVYGGVFLLSALVQPLAGRASDRVGRDGVLVLNTLAAAAGFGLLLYGSTQLSAYGAAALLGIGLSWAGVMQVRIMDRLPEDGATVGFGVVRTVYMFAGALGSVVTGTLADYLGWTAAYGLVAGLLVVVSATLVLNRVLSLRL